MISYNRLPEVPDVICELPHLKVLQISHNKLSTLPLGFRKLINLEELVGIACLFIHVFQDVSFNQFKEFPLDLMNLQALKAVNISHNVLESLPAGWFDYFSFVRSNWNIIVYVI